MSLENLTALSSTFIVVSGLSLLCGWYLIRFRKNRSAHQKTMLAATAFAGLFLVAYVYRWASFGSKSFEGTGWWKAAYLIILVPHILLAMVVGPLAIYLIYLAMVRKDYLKHRRWARVTLPIWLFVAASGWAIYYMLYHLSF